VGSPDVPRATPMLLHTAWAAVAAGLQPAFAQCWRSGAGALRPLPLLPAAGAAPACPPPPGAAAAAACRGGCCHTLLAALQDHLPVAELGRCGHGAAAPARPLPHSAAPQLPLEGQRRGCPRKLRAGAPRQWAYPAYLWRGRACPLALAHLTSPAPKLGLYWGIPALE
jgi:hypothetical protein